MAAGGGHHFTWLEMTGVELFKQYPHVGNAALTATIMLVGAAAYRLKTRSITANSSDEAFVPSEKMGVQNIFELIGGFVQGIAKDIIGHQYKKYLPLLIFYFIWTLLNNLMGVFPGFGSATDNLNTTLAMGGIVFIYYNVQGFLSHGIKYLEHFAGHLHGALLWTLGPVLFVIELISHAVRPVTLGMRLRSNIYADHTVYGIVLDLLQGARVALEAKLGAVGAFLGHLIVGIGPVPIVILGLLVCVIQAFVFTLLTTIYVGMATAHEDEH